MRDQEEQASWLQQCKGIPGYLDWIPNMLNDLEAGDEIEAFRSELLGSEDATFEIASNRRVGSLNWGYGWFDADDIFKPQPQEFLYKGAVACTNIQGTSPARQRGQVRIEQRAIGDCRQPGFCTAVKRCLFVSVCQGLRAEHRVSIEHPAQIAFNHPGVHVFGQLPRGEC